MPRNNPPGKAAPDYTSDKEPRGQREAEVTEVLLVRKFKALARAFTHCEIPDAKDRPNFRRILIEFERRFAPVSSFLLAHASNRKRRPKLTFK
jgi:hypothetical protein